MPPLESNGAGNAWYSADRASFFAADQQSIVAELSSSASAQGWHIEPQQHEEWDASVGILREEMQLRAGPEIEILRGALGEAGLTAYSRITTSDDAVFVSTASC